ncbi:MAG: efflux RND transporter periplasmic adaptor subunit [Francisellaceae bacterium]|nr:efflux RND transporter periplasmic adaptor subunit [Francisellaceae bacterium]
MMKKICIKYVIFILIGFILGVVTQKLYQTSFKSNTTEKKIIYWVAPMDPNYRKDKAGKSPMGMDLIPVYEGDEANTTDTSIMISPTIEHNLGVRTAKVEKQEIFRMIDTVGSITVDENQIEHTHVYAEGWIKELLVKVEGEHVKKGQLLFKIYSPKIVTAQDEYLLALQNKNIALKGAATKKLQSLGFSTKQFKDLEYTKKSNELTDIYAEQDGVVSQLNIGEGMFVKPDSILIVVEDLSKIWMIADVYERQSNWVKVGQKAEMILPYIPGKIWSGEVNYIYPSLDLKSQTLRVRMMFENKSGDLKLNMFGDVKIYAEPRKDIIVIPREAVIYTGKETRVVLKQEQGRYSTRVINVGMESDDIIEVIHGLSEGEEIVTSAQFLLDSESSLKASFNRIDASSNTSSHNGV